MLGIIGGTSLLDYSGTDLCKRAIPTPYGTSEVLWGDNVLLLLRHQNRRAPHRISFRSHLSALKLAGADQIVAIGSTGSLKPYITPGSRIIPDNFISLAPVPTIFNHSIGHVAPVFDPVLRSSLSRVCPDAVNRGTYIQTCGPRLETVPEICCMASCGEVVGMTIGSELTIACELNLPFAAICTVDNYANGVCNADIRYESILETARENHGKTVDLLERIISSV